MLGRELGDGGAKYTEFGKRESKQELGKMFAVALMFVCLQKWAFGK